MITLKNHTYPQPWRREVRPGVGEANPLSHAEEIELAARIARGDEDARNCLVQGNLGLVIKIARAFRRRGLEMDDLVGEGNLGLLRAAQKYDPRFRTRFSTYATYWIKESIRRTLMDTTNTIRVPGHLYALLSKMRRVEREHTLEVGELPSFDQVASLMGLSEKQKMLVVEARRARRVAHECNYGAASTSRLSDEVMDPRDSTEAVVEAYEEQAAILDRFALLLPLERAVLALRYGLEGEDASMSKVARQMEMSRRAVNLIHRRAIQKLGACELAPTLPVEAPSRCDTRIAAPPHARTKRFTLDALRNAETLWGSLTTHNPPPSRRRARRPRRDSQLLERRLEPFPRHAFCSVVAPSACRGPSPRGSSSLRNCRAGPALGDGGGLPLVFDGHSHRGQRKW